MAKISMPSRAKTDGILIDGVLDVDEAAEVIPFNYTITAYGSDPPVDGLIKRMKDGDILVPLFSLARAAVRGIPKFQREYVWKKQQADRFVESLLLGLPVPGIFLVKEDSGRHLVLDGHQRLQTLLRFYTNDWEGGAFVLESVQDRFRNRGYDELSAVDRRRLDDSIIHATVVKQDDPGKDLSSVYLIFERLNTGGTSLQPQEIRVALYHGPLVELLTELNSHPSWRALVGRKSKRLKDIELILRFFALLEGSASYSRPMKGFLNGYMARRRAIKANIQDEFRALFKSTSDAILASIGPKAFKPQTSVNAAMVDALMVGIARRIRKKGRVKAPVTLRAIYKRMVGDRRFQAAIARATADEDNVKTRLSIATAMLGRAKAPGARTRRLRPARVTLVSAALPGRNMRQRLDAPMAAGPQPRRWAGANGGRWRSPRDRVRDGS